MASKRMAKVAIVGRANVGKSTLFNKLIEKNKAIVSEVAGTTRDRNIDVASWQGQSFELIDTGGLDIDVKKANNIEKGILRQSEKAIKDADLILLVIDAKSGVLSTDKEIAKNLMRQDLKDKTMLIANKADSLKWRQQDKEVYKLGIGEINYVSAANGSGIGDLLDEIATRLSKLKLTKTDYTNDKSQKIKLAIVGRPNVGKSSLLNSILGEERVIVTDTPHTTRESHDSEFKYKDNDFIIIDTAGIVRSGKVGHKSLEKKSIDKSFSAIAGADVVILVTEVQQRISMQDKKITQKILEEGKSVIIVANKWDLIPDKDTNTINKYIEYYQTEFPYLWWAPVLFMSAKEDLRSKKILDLAIEIKNSRKTELNQSQLDRFLKSKIKQHKPSRGKGLKNPYIYKIEQTGINPPRFFIHVNDPLTLHFSYIRFLQNNLRETFKIIGTPIQMEVKKWKSSENSKVAVRKNKKR
ncbi:MAG: ribosome biogenesis GTPase Der [Candidatus Buchananbacteria bacterium]